VIIRKSFYTIVSPKVGPEGLAYAPDSFKIWLEPNIELLTGWTIPTFELRDASADASLSDLLANNAAMRLCSKKMRDILEMWRSPSDLVEWLPVEVKSGGKNHPYFIPHLLEELDVLDLSRSIIARGTPLFVIKPYLNLERIGGHQVFRYKGGSDLVLCISNEVRLALLKEGCTGCRFWRMPAG
jgi:hypothetical protein